MQLNASIDQLFANLASVSDNHLRAFTNLLNRTAEVYVPRYLGQAAYNQVISTASRGAGNGRFGGRP